MYFSQRAIGFAGGSSFTNSALPLLVFKLIGSATNLALPVSLPAFVPSSARACTRWAASM